LALGRDVTNFEALQPHANTALQRFAELLDNGWMDRIVADPEVCSGKPVIKGTRIMVRNILSMLKAGKSPDEVLVSYPGITREDVDAAVDYAIELVDEVRLLPRAG
jgi:uncharacterized protein (DUF433 family)